MTVNAKTVTYARAQVAIDDPEGEADAVAPLTPEQARANLDDEVPYAGAGVSQARIEGARTRTAPRTRTKDPLDGGTQSYALGIRAGGVLDEGTPSYVRARWTREDLRERVAAGPPLTYPKPDADETARIVAAYEGVTGDLVRSPGKRNLLVACHRVHGRRLLDVVAAQFAESGKDNLLGIVRCTHPPDIDCPWTADELADLDAPAGPPDFDWASLEEPAEGDALFEEGVTT